MLTAAVCVTDWVSCLSQVCTQAVSPSCCLCCRSYAAGFSMLAQAELVHACVYPCWKVHSSVQCRNTLRASFSDLGLCYLWVQLFLLAILGHLWSQCLWLAGKIGDTCRHPTRSGYSGRIKREKAVASHFSGTVKSLFKKASIYLLFQWAISASLQTKYKGAELWC